MKSLKSILFGFVLFTGFSQMPLSHGAPIKTTDGVGLDVFADKDIFDKCRNGALDRLRKQGITVRPSSSNPSVVIRIIVQTLDAGDHYVPVAAMSWQIKEANRVIYSRPTLITSGGMGSHNVNETCDQGLQFLLDDKWPWL
jgi:hypothetical protein